MLTDTMVRQSKSLSLLMALAFILMSSGQGKLKKDFYSKTCPNVEAIVLQALQQKVSETFIAIPATVRLFFHDCCVQGCDASILISSPNAERDAPDNLSLAPDGFDTIIRAKQAVEAQCPGVVSCADILAIAARDVVVMAGGPAYPVELGRLDGLRSDASDVAGNLPEPTFNLDELNSLFAKLGLSQTDMIALSGGHTIGFTHCSRFANRLYSFSPSSPVDPSLNPDYAQQLMGSCPVNVAPDIVVPNDPTTLNTFDNAYFQNLVAGKGLMQSDEVLFTNPASRNTVLDFARNSGDFAAAYIAAVTKLGRVGVKTGNQGQIRRDCTSFN